MGRFNWVSPGSAISGGIREAMQAREIDARQARKDALEEARIAREIEDAKLRREMLVEDQQFQRDDRVWQKEQRDLAARVADVNRQQYMQGDKLKPGHEDLVPHDAEQTLAGRRLGSISTVVPTATERDSTSLLAAPAPDTPVQRPMPPDTPGPMVAASPAMIAQSATGELIARGTPQERAANAKKMQDAAAFQQWVKNNPTMMQDPTSKGILEYTQMTGEYDKGISALIARATALAKPVEKKTLEEGGFFWERQEDGTWKNMGGPGPAQTEKPGLSDASKAVQIDRMQRRWDGSQSEARKMGREYSRMKVALDRFTSDEDRVGGQLAIINGFNHLVDPNSVVREGEYARTAEGAAYLDRAYASFRQWFKEGSKVPDHILVQMVETARRFSEDANSHSTGIRRRMERTADEFGINRNLVFDDEGEPNAPPPGPGKPGAPNGAAPPAGGTDVNPVTGQRRTNPLGIPPARR